MTLRSAATVAACVALSPVAAWAQTGDLPPRSPSVLLAQALLSLAVVVGLIYLVYFGIRRIGDRQPDGATEGPMKVIQTRHLGGDRWLYLIEVEGRRIIVGGADGQITPVAELERIDRAAAGGERRDEA